MTTDTEKHLLDYIERLKSDRDAAEERARAAEQERSEQGWSAPRTWREDGLPVPRLELHWERFGAGDRCIYVLVRRHLLGDVAGTPLGQTTRHGGRGRFVHDDGQLVTPFRDGAHAKHDALHLGLPLYVTTCDGDAVLCESMSEHDWGVQRVIRRAGAQPRSVNRM